MKIHLEFEMFDASANITPPKHPGDSGCDLGVPETVRFAPGETKFVGHRVRARMMFEDDSAHRRRVGFCLYPRSSISKTPLRLANSVGVIDAGQDGELIAALTNTSAEEYVVEAGTRLVQVCHPTLLPQESIQAKVEGDEDRALQWTRENPEGANISRGEGGFGSTGTA